MRIWLINAGEPTPVDEGQFRLWRMGILAQMAADAGHDVVWWNSTFLHAKKTQRFTCDRTVEVDGNYRINFIHAPVYTKNVSLARIRNHVLLGRRFAAWARRERAPDVILCSLPTLELSDAAVQYGHEHGVPIVLDIRDLWPDAMLDLVPPWSHALGRLALSPYYRMSRRACAGATAICGHTRQFVQWGLRRGRRRPSALDRDFPFGYVPLRMTADESAEADRFWRAKGVGVDPSIPIVCFFGTIGHQFDFDTVLEAVRKLHPVRRVQFVLCGEGDSVAHYRRQSADLPDVLFPGWASAQQIWSLMTRSSFGLAPYVDTQGFRHSLPNKGIEYLAGGLPILCSLSQGPLAELATTQECGIGYDGCANQLCQAILKSLSTPPRLARLAANARQIFSSKYDASHVYGDLLAYLDTLAATRSASSPVAAA